MTHYDCLGLPPSASVQQIRQAYRDLSKLYHPDTTTLPQDVATVKFQILNEAYATLSNPERRLAYDHTIGYSRISVIQAPRHWDDRPSADTFRTNKMYLDPSDRPLSAGELFALLLLGVTIVACAGVAIAVGVVRGDLG